MSENLIYWKKFDNDATVTFIDKVTGKEGRITGEWICNDDRVDRFWVIGCATGEEPLVLRMKGMLLMKSGEMWESSAVDASGEIVFGQTRYDKLINQAEEYLKSIV